MKTYRSAGEVVTLTAPGGGVTKDVPVQIGQLLVIPTSTVAADLPFEGMTRGVFSGLPKTGSQAWSEGEAIYWDAETNTFTNVAGDNHLAGRCLEELGAGSGVTETGRIFFDGMLSAADETT